MPPVTQGLRETPLLVFVFVVLFLGLALLAFFFVTGESRRAELLVEYEADRTASGLLDVFRAERELDPASIDPRVRGFGIYRASGDPLSNPGGLL